VGGVVIKRKIADTFKDRVFPGGLTYSGHPLACASIVASIGIFKEERIVEHARSLGTDVIGPELAKIAAKHPSVGEVRGLGVFWALDLVSDRQTRAMLAPYGGASAAMTTLAAQARAAGLLTFINYNRLHVVPPCTITEAEAKEGLAILDEVLTTTDTYYRG
jgi:taurine--2-oxoglutarate transaminase